MGEKENAVISIVVFLAACGDCGVHGSGDNQGGTGHSHKGGHGGCDGRVEGLLATAEAACNEAASKNLQSRMLAKERESFPKARTNQKNVGKDAAQHAGLDDADFALSESDNTDLWASC